MIQNVEGSLVKNNLGDDPESLDHIISTVTRKLVWLISTFHAH